MQIISYEGYFEKGLFYSSGSVIQIPEQSRIIITILENKNAGSDKSNKRELGFVDVPPLPDSFFDPLPDEELELWGL